MYLKSTINDTDKFLVISPNGISSSFEMIFFGVSFYRIYKDENYILLKNELIEIINEETENLSGNNFEKTNLFLDYINNNFKCTSIEKYGLNKIHSIRESLFIKHKLRLLSVLNKESYEEISTTIEMLSVSKKRSIVKFFLYQKLFFLYRDFFRYKQEIIALNKEDKSEKEIIQMLFRKLETDYLINEIPKNIKNSFLKEIEENFKSDPLKLVNMFHIYFYNKIIKKTIRSELYYKKYDLSGSLKFKDNLNTKEAFLYKKSLEDFYLDFKLNSYDLKSIDNIGRNLNSSLFSVMKELFLFIIYNIDLSEV